MSDTFRYYADPFRYIGRKCKEEGTDVVKVRILSVPIYCMLGEEASMLFHNEEYFAKRDGAPEFLKNALMGGIGLAPISEEEEAHRKTMVTSVLTERHEQAMCSTFKKNLLNYTEEWQHSGRDVVLYDELKMILLETFCDWVGIPLKEEEIELRTRNISSLVEDVTKLPKNLQVRVARIKTEAWLGSWVEKVRSGEYRPARGTAMEIFTSFRDLKGELLDNRVVSAEILNLLRPISSLALFMVKGLHAAYAIPSGARNYLLDDSDVRLDHYIQEVRRFYPFLPAFLRKVKKDFIWKGFVFKAGTRALLDVYGTDHDERIWDRPEEFDPERFAGKAVTNFSFISQVGPSVFLQVKLVKTFLRFFTHELHFELPEQSLEIDFSHPPALVHDGFKITNVHFKHAAERENMFQ